MFSLLYRRLCSILLMAIGVSALSAGSALAQTPLTLEPLPIDLDTPIFITAAPGDTARLFIVEQPGRIKIFHTPDSTESLFLDITARVTDGGEMGLLGLAFHPNYFSNGYFYVNYTDVRGGTRYSFVSRFKVTLDPDVADPDSEQILIQLEQPYSNHNGGMMAFGPLDDYLYIGFGDGGSGGDPQNNAQNPQTLLGKILRVDVDTTEGYRIPADNPFEGNIDTLPEIWAMGLRNPWRFSFDRITGDMYIGDVGQASWEEVDFQSSASGGGENYGWRRKEGDHCYLPSTGCETGFSFVDPIYEYSHGGSPFRCSITGGYVYRGCAIPDLQGEYFFGDYCSGQVWSVQVIGGVAADTAEHTSEIGAGELVSFGQDAKGELYVVSQSGDVIYKVAPDGVPSQCGAQSCCVGMRGNVDGVGGEPGIDIADVLYMVDYQFGNPPGPAPNCELEADVNATGSVDIADLLYLVEYSFGNPAGPAPLVCM